MRVPLPPLGRGASIGLLCCWALSACAFITPSTVTLRATSVVPPYPYSPPTATPSPLPAPLASPQPLPTSTPSASAYAQELQAGVMLRDDGVLLVAGQPFFPFGFALYPRYEGGSFGAETLQAIAASGFNTLHAPIRDNYHDLMDDALRLNIHLLAEIYPYELEDSEISRIIAAVKDHPALLAYAIADDVDDGNYYTPERVTWVNQLVKQVDRQHPTYISGYRPDRIADFMASADIVAMQSYPIGKSKADLASIGHVNVALAQTQHAAQPFKRSIMANLQSFAWPDRRSPTPDEVRNMTYQALVNNVRGIIYYTYDDGFWRIEQHPALLQAVQGLAPEINYLAPALLNGVYTPIESGNPHILAAQWLYDQSRYVIVVNTAQQATQTSLSLPAPSSRAQAEPIFPGRPAGMRLSNNQLSGRLEPLAVHVYRIDAGE